MLQQLKIKNIAIIDECTINFGQGFNILTGETGAGKSIIIDSLNFVLGARADRTLIKSGTDFATVTGVFDLSDVDDYEEIFNEVGLEAESTLIISRHMTVAGKNECRINGELTTLNVVRKITSKLVDIFGQHDSTALLDAKNHLGLLDQVNYTKVEPKILECNNIWSQIKEVDVKINSLGGLGTERERNIDILKFQINEITNSNLYDGEEEDLNAKLVKLQNSEKIVNVLNNISNLLDGEFSVSGAVKNASQNIDTLTKYDESFAEIGQRLKSVKYEIDDITDTINSERSGIEFSTNELNFVIDRLNQINDLKRKYGSTVSEVLTYLKQSEIKLDELLNSVELIEQLKHEKLALKNQLKNVALQLSKARKENAKFLQNSIVGELKELGMKNAQFEVKFNNFEDQDILDIITANGADDVEFLFSANLGIPCQPLSKIISGGEMSRFMLAFKCVTSSNIKTYVFDEIDTGIGGDIGTVVAKKMSLVAKNAQVLCVTHLAQIACFGDINFKIQKFESDGTYTNVILLDSVSLVDEITRMIGKVSSSEFAYKHAEELIKEASIIKSNL